MKKDNTRALVWFRQDLRLKDNPAFIHACQHHDSVIPLYINDDKHPLLGEAQGWWLHHSLCALKESLEERGLTLLLRSGNSLDILAELIDQYAIDAVYWNRCYEPQAIERDKKIKAVLLEAGAQAYSSNGRLLHEPWTIKNKAGDVFSVFTPYWKACRQILQIPPRLRLTTRPQGIKTKGDSLEDWALLPRINWAKGFAELWEPGEKGAIKKLKFFIANHLSGYKTNRDFPAEQSSSYLSPHLHFGEMSPWDILRSVDVEHLPEDCDRASVDHFLSELGWREFSTYLLYHFPKLPSENFRPAFDKLIWKKDIKGLHRWQKGMTGYPLVDAGMRELWATGYMHNRVRMVVASFLTKDLFIDWRVGADWFLDTLVDADLASNSSNWQWVAGCGADAAPYFRIFNPVLQSQKFDPEGTYIRRWVPELAELSNQAIHAPWEHVEARCIYSKSLYPKPIVDHSRARKEALAGYKALKD